MTCIARWAFLVAASWVIVSILVALIDYAWGHR